MSSDLEIARSVAPQPLADVAARLGIGADALIPWGRDVAKVDPSKVTRGAPGRLVLVTAISPTPAGEGKTTTTIGLGDALRQRGVKAALALREPALGPCFGQKGGATGGGHAQVIPMERINLHLTGDFHAIASATNLLAALIDNSIHHGNPLRLDPRRITWGRSVNVNDRALRDVVVGLGGPANGYVRESRFDIDVASEVMAVLCLAKDLDDLQVRLGRIVVGFDVDRQPVTAADLQAVGSMAVLLQDAVMPNLVQTLEGTPALVHGGPFANIAHGCNSVIATQLALDTADVVVTEAGFGADLGAEKFLDIKSRQAGLDPSAAVVVATIRAVKMHGGVALADLGAENVAAVEAGMANVERHVRNVQSFGLPVVVAVNAFTSDTPAELARLQQLCRERLGVDGVLCTHWADGGKGALELADKVLALSGAAFAPIYDLDLPLADKVRTIATKLYGAADVSFSGKATKALADFEALGFGDLPVCMAKTQYSFSADPSLRGAPSGHTLPVVDARLSAGAGFVVILCGDIMTLPGLPAEPAAHRIGLDADGQVVGLS